MYRTILCVFVPTLFCYGMQKEIRTQWNRAEQCKQGKTKTTKNLLQIHISSTSFLKSGNLEMFYNELKSWTEDFWNSKKKKKDWQKGPCQNWNCGSLWKLVQCVTLLTSCKDARLLKTTAKITGICHRIFGGWGGGANKKTNTNKKLHQKNRTYTEHTNNMKKNPNSAK